jgi:hypothetical protein
MKEDILEQLASDYFEAHGYFTLTNVKFKPDKSEPDYETRQDCVHSDIDVLGFHPLRTGPDRVVAISCKSWQEGFAPKWEIDNLNKDAMVGGRESWRRYRELANKKWAKALRRAILEKTGQAEFVYYTAVTRLAGQPEEREIWENYPAFRENLGCTIKVITLAEMAEFVLSHLTETVANSELGRTLQLLKAAGFLPKQKGSIRHS